MSAIIQAPPRRGSSPSCSNSFAILPLQARLTYQFDVWAQEIAQINQANQAVVQLKEDDEPTSVWQTIDPDEPLVPVES